MKKELLDELAERANSTCLSDLHTAEFRKRIYFIVMHFDPFEYTQKEWEQAVAYVLSEPVKKFENQEHAKRYLLARLG